MLYLDHNGGLLPEPGRPLFRFVRRDGKYQSKWRRIPIDNDSVPQPGLDDRARLGKDYRIETRRADP